MNIKAILNGSERETWKVTEGLQKCQLCQRPIILSIKKLVLQLDERTKKKNAATLFSPFGSGQS